MKNLRKLINNKSKPLVIPGVYDAISAKIAQKVGFDAMFQTGYGTSASMLGMPDYGFIGKKSFFSAIVPRQCRSQTHWKACRIARGAPDNDPEHRYVDQIGLEASAGQFFHEKLVLEVHKKQIKDSNIFLQEARLVCLLLLTCQR